MCPERDSHRMAALTKRNSALSSAEISSTNYQVKTLNCDHRPSEVHDNNSISGNYHTTWPSLVKQQQNFHGFLLLWYVTRNR